MSPVKNVHNENKVQLVYDEQQITRVKDDIEKKIGELAHLLKEIRLSSQDTNKYLSKINCMLQINGQRVKKRKGISLYIGFVGKFPIKTMNIVIDIVIGLLLISLGWAMIIIPAPFPAFEIATLFYFNEQDGVTVMDLISLLIVFFGSKIIIETLSKIS